MAIVWLHLFAVGLAGMVGAPQVAAASSAEAAQAAYDKGDYKRALSLWRELAAKNDPFAQFSIGVMYERGLGVSADVAEAARHYRSAADAGFAAAQFNLGAAYESGRGVPKDLVQAAKWWRQAAAQGFTRAQYNLAVLYYYGWGVDKDLNEAARLFELAAASGDAGAARILSGLRAEMARSGGAPAAQAAQATPGKSLASPPAASAVGSVEPTLPAGGRAPALPAGQAEDGRSDGALARSGLLGEDWIRSQPADRYTVQMFANWTADSVARFAQEQAVGSSCAWFVTRYEGAPWYTLLCGTYASAEEANAALDRLPAQVRIMGPWVRQFGGVQDMMGARQPAAAAAADPAPGPRPAAPAVPAAPAGGAVVAGDWPPAGDATAWIRTRDPGHYTIQLYAADSSEAALRFIRQHDLQGKAAYFVSQRLGRPWYSVIYGSYPGYSDAKKAVRSLPAQARKWSPWIREFGKVQAALDAAAPTATAPQLPQTARADPGADAHRQLAAGQSAFNKGDYARAMALWRPLAESGLVQAQYNVAFLLETGWSGERDLAASAQLYDAAARHGHLQSQFNLAMLYLEGHGVGRDEDAGLRWLRRAAEGGYDKARETLADGYARGLYGLPRDSELAAYWGPGRP